MLERKEDIFNPEIEVRDHRTNKQAIEMDMNPMVDLAFLLLTFFMLTTTFNQPQTMELVMPAKPDKDAVEQEQPVKESRTLSIVLEENNKIYWFQGITDPEVKKTNFSADGLRNILLTKNNEIRDIVVLIKPTKRSTYKNLVDVLDEMTITSIERYAIVKAEKSDIDLVSNLQE